MVAPVLAEETVSFLWDNFDDRDPNSKPELAPNGVNMWALDGISYCKYLHVRIEGADGGDTLLLGQFAVRQRGFVRQRGICDGIARALAIPSILARYRACGRVLKRNRSKSLTVAGLVNR